MHAIIIMVQYYLYLLYVLNTRNICIDNFSYLINEFLYVNILATLCIQWTFSTTTGLGPESHVLITEVSSCQGLRTFISDKFGFSGLQEN
jgi:hypothetical protein